MRVVIIEDEQLTAEDLADILLQLPENIKVDKILSSVAEAITYFANSKVPDLIFCDIELGDGFSFEIFEKIKIDTPVIFCTAFNKYALEAFKNNGINYILKPFTKNSIAEAISKFAELKRSLFAGSFDFQQLLNLQSSTNQPAVSSLLVNWKDKIIPVKLPDIALFRIDYKTTQLITYTNTKYSLAQTLDELEIICGNRFYRANRQNLVGKEAIREAVQYHARKLFLSLNIEGEFDITISKSKVPEFLSWLKS